MNATETIDAVHSLIDTCREGREGFQIAAEKTEDPDLKELFASLAGQRKRFRAELESLCRQMGEPRQPENGKIAEALHRGWVNIKSAVMSRDSHAILCECERGEDSTRDEYLRVLDEGLPNEIREVVQRQYRDIISAHDRVKALRDARAERS